MKRVFDIAAATGLLVVLSPLLLAIATLIRVCDGSPVLFVQRRVGKGGRDFDILKFRTMKGCDKKTICAHTSSGSFEPGDRSRVTTLGRLLRKLKFDELPQLWNVLRGEMSLVGPRPEVRPWVEVYPERWRIIHTIAPGVTDPAAIEFRDEEELLERADDPETTYREIVLPRKLASYEQYVARHSLMGDLLILFKTVIAVFRF